MNRLLTTAARAIVLILTGEREVWAVAAVSLEVSVVALALGAAVGVPLGYVVALSPRRVAQTGSWLLHTLAALPTVIVGLTLYFVFSAAGPLGWMDLLYTRVAMIVGQWVLAAPLMGALTLAAVSRLQVEARETATTLGLAGVTRMMLLLREARVALTSALLVAFGRVFTELGAAVILGGNIRGHTRTLTTVIALEYNKGDDARAMAYGIILLLVALMINGVVHGISAWTARAD